MMDWITVEGAEIVCYCFGVDAIKNSDKSLADLKMSTKACTR